MNYTTKDINRNMIILIVTNIFIGFFVGFRDLSTTMQVLFSKVGGEELLVGINQITYYALVVCLFMIGINVQKVELKFKIIALEMMTYLTYLIIGILLITGKLTAIPLFVLMCINMIFNRILYVFTIDYRMKIMPKAYFKKTLSDITFVQTITTIIGMYASYYVIRIPYPYNFATIMFVGFAIGVITNIMFAFMVEKTPKKGKHDPKDNITFKKIIEVSKEKNFILMNLGKFMLNMSYGILILYAMYALRLGYRPREIVLFGIVGFAFKAIVSILAPKIKLSSRQIMMVSHLLYGIAIMMTYITKNFYIGFALYGIAEGLINLGYYGYMNSLDDERRHIYLTGQTFFNITTGLSIPFASYILNTFGFDVISIISVILAFISIAFIEPMDEVEETKIHIFQHFRHWMHV